MLPPFPQHGVRQNRYTPFAARCETYGASSHPNMSDLSQQKAPVVGGDTVGIKLASAFGFLVSILVCVSWLGLSRMGRINADLNEILDRRWARVELAREGLFYPKSTYQNTTHGS